MKPHLKVVQHPNPTRRSFHVTCVIGQLPIKGSHSFGKSSFLFSSNEDGDPGYEVKALAERLENIPGVKDGRLERYEVNICIADAFSWNDIGPLVIGEIVRSIFPEVDDSTLEVSVSLGWSYYGRPGLYGFENDEHRIRYRDTVDHQPIEVHLDPLHPSLDIEYMLDKNALAKVKMAENWDSE